MDTQKGSLEDYVQRLQQKDPRFLDLLTAETAEEFDEAFDWLLESALMLLERNKVLFKELPEDGLSAVLAARMSAVGVVVTQQKHSNGHVDLTIEAQTCGPAWVKLGEAKIYNGPAYHVQGLKQLLGRYTTGRESRGVLIEYVRQARVAGLVQKIRETMDEQRPMDQIGTTRDHPLKWSFLSTHRHSCGECLEVGHVACNLFVDRGNQVSATA